MQSSDSFPARVLARPLLACDVDSYDRVYARWHIARWNEELQRQIFRTLICQRHEEGSFIATLSLSLSLSVCVHVVCVWCGVEWGGLALNYCARRSCLDCASAQCTKLARVTALCQLKQAH